MNLDNFLVVQTSIIIQTLLNMNESLHLYFIIIIIKRHVQYLAPTQKDQGKMNYSFAIHLPQTNICRNQQCCRDLPKLFVQDFLGNPKFIFTDFFTFHRAGRKTYKHVDAFEVR